MKPEIKKKIEHKIPKMLTCPHCKKQVRSYSYLNSHMVNYHPEISFTPYQVPKAPGNTISEMGE